MSSSAAEAFLNSIATDVSVAEFTQALTEHPEWMPTRASNPTVVPAPVGQLDPMLEMSGLSAAQQGLARREARDPSLGVRLAAHDVRVAARLVDSTLSTQRAAELLGRDPSNIRRGVHEGRYYAVRMAGKLRLPDWQFVEQVVYDQTPGEDAVPDTEFVPLPNLSVLARSIPSAMHPLTVEGFMHTPQPELSGQTPVEWLSGGGEPTAVGDLLSGLDHR